ncbi:MAG: hypothetical protein ACYCOU_16725, partial [Sulfobacillus sp.]
KSNANAEPGQRVTFAVLKKAISSIATRAGLPLDPVWLGREVTSALRSKCEYGGCKIKHGSAALAERDSDGTLSAVRLCQNPDFSGKSRAKTKPACLEAYAELRGFLPALCKTFADADHSDDRCSCLHLDLGLVDTASAARPLLPQAVSLLLPLMCTRVEKASSKVYSLELLNTIEAALSVPNLPAALRLKKAGGKVTRKGIGRAVGKSGFWDIDTQKETEGDTDEAETEQAETEDSKDSKQRRDPKTRAYPGFKLTETDIAKLQEAVRGRFGAQEAESAVARPQVPAAAPPALTVNADGSVTMPATSLEYFLRCMMGMTAAAAPASR